MLRLSCVQSLNAKASGRFSLFGRLQPGCQIDALLQEILRKAINLDQLQAMLSKVRSAHYNFSGDLDFCQTLIDTAAKSRLSNKAILAKDGQLLKMPAARVDAPDAPKSFHAETVTVVPETEKVQGDWHAPLDA